MNKLKLFLINLKQLIATAIGVLIVLFILVTLVYYFITGEFILYALDADITNHWHQTPNKKPEIFR